MTPRFAFLARASVRDGLGHLVRSLCVFRPLLRLTEAKIFLVGDRSGSHLIDEAGLPWHFCESDREAANQAGAYGAGAFVFDMLDFETPAFESLKSRGLTVSLSPVFRHLADVDHLFLRTKYVDPRWKPDPRFPKVHKGLRFAILPDWLHRISRSRYREHLQENRLSVAISMGGSDAPNRTLSLIDRLGRCNKRMVLWVALGDAYTHSYEELIKCAAENSQEIILIKSNDSMWRVLKNAALVICAGGLTTYEAAYMGIPTINVIQNAAWSFLFTELEESGACIKIQPQPDSLDRVVSHVMSLEGGRDLLLHMHDLTKNLIPRGGATRVARQLLQITSGPRDRNLSQCQHPSPAN